MKCLIVDDEKLARTLLEKYVEKLPNLELVGQAKNAFEATAVLQEKAVDLVFMDIQMPELTGIELLNTMSEKPLVIITTAYQQYALEGYQLDVVDYLLKPFRFDRFMQAIHKAARRWQATLPATPSSTAPKSPATSSDFMLVRSNHKVHKVPYASIRYIEGMKEYIAIHLETERIIVLQSLKQLMLDLPADQFLRIHKSYIIAIDKVTATDSTQVYLGKTTLPIGGSYKEEVQQHLF